MTKSDRLIVLTLCSTLVLASCSTIQTESLAVAEDDTVYLQSLLDATVQEIRIPSRDKPWVTKPLFISNKKDTRIVFEPGCEIIAQKGEFRATNDCLLTIRDSTGLHVIGYGAKLVMRKEEYRKSPYVKAQSRHGLSILRSTDILVEGLHIEKTGGDGVYIGQHRNQPVNKNLKLKQLLLKDNFRQGISVIAADTLTIEECTITETKGQAPMAGIDFEPNTGVYGFTNVLVANCVFKNNRGAGLQIVPKKMKPEQPPVDITIQNCTSEKNLVSFAVYGVPKGVRGRIQVTDNRFKGIKWIRSTNTFKVILNGDTTHAE